MGNTENQGAPVQQVNTSAIIANQSVSEQLLSMEKRVRLFKVTGALRSNRTGVFCDGLPSMEIWAETSQQAEFAYAGKHPQALASDLRGAWVIKSSCIME